MSNTGFYNRGSFILGNCNGGSAIINFRGLKILCTNSKLCYVFNQVAIKVIPKKKVYAWCKVNVITWCEHTEIGGDSILLWGGGGDCLVLCVPVGPRLCSSWIDCKFLLKAPYLMGGGGGLLHYTLLVYCSNSPQCPLLSTLSWSLWVYCAY